MTFNNPLKFDWNPYGKPFLAYPVPSSPLQLNLSHARDVALYAFTYDRQVGIDEEYKPVDFDFEALAGVSLSPHEQSVLRSVPDDLQREVFYNCWTRKEAYVKAKGKGLSIPLSQFEVSCLPGEPAALLQSRDDPGEIRRWTLRELYLFQPLEGDILILGTVVSTSLLKTINNLWGGFMGLPTFFVHPTAEVSPEAQVGAGTRIWRQVHVREHARIGESCNIGKGVYIDAYVYIGSNVKIQNHASLFEGVTLEDGVFVGPHVCFTNDVFPRAITPDGKLKSGDDWEITPTLVKYGASIGAGAVIVCGVTIGSFALVGAGALVMRDVPPHALVYGNPAHQHGYVCRCARRLTDVREENGALVGWCETCEQACDIGSAH